jgi:hypothetical protein
MARAHVQTREFIASRHLSLITSSEVLRLVNDITTCSVEWEDRPDLERQLQEVCPGCHPSGTGTLPRLKSLLEVVRRSGHGAIFLLGLSPEQLHDPHIPIENQVRLARPVPVTEPWLQYLVGLAKSDGAVIFNDKLEAVQFRARLKPATVCLLPDQDDLGSGMRHQVTREFSAYAPGVLGVCVSQDSYISLYRHGKLVSRLY